MVGWLRQSSDEQHSLEAQRNAFDAFCQQHNFTKTTILEHVGSATGNDPLAFFKTAAPEYATLKSLLDDRTADFVWAIDPTRFGRAKWLYNYMIQYIIDNNAVAYASGVGEINPDNFDAMVAITSIGSQADIKRLHGDRARQTYINKIQQGIPSKRTPWTHKKRYHDGKVIGADINPDAQALFQILTPKFLAQDSWRSISNYVRAHHPNTLGVRDKTTIRRLFWHPMLHGNLTYGSTNEFSELFQIEEGHPIPDGFYVAYNVVPKMWDDETHKQVIAELKSRKGQVGRYLGNTITNPFNRIFKCAICKTGNMCSAYSGPHHIIRCTNKCSRNTCRVETLKTWFTEQIQYALEHGILQINANTDHIYEQWQRQVADLDHAIAHQESILINLVNQSARFTTLQDIYIQQIDAAEKSLTELKRQLNQIKSRKPEHPDSAGEALEQINELTVQGLWDLPPSETSRILRQLIGNTELFIYRTEITIV